MEPIYVDAETFLKLHEEYVENVGMSIRTDGNKNLYVTEDNSTIHIINNDAE